MSSTDSPKRGRRQLAIRAEALESRQLLTGGAGSIFAVEAGTVATAGTPVPMSFTINPSEFTIPKGKFTLGIDIAADGTSTVEPFIVAVENSKGQVVASTHAPYDTKVSRSNTYDGSKSSAVTLQIALNKKDLTAPQTYTVEVMSIGSTTGTFDVGWYLPGDADGDGTVSAADIKTIKSEMGKNANSTAYTFDADANRDGKITSADMAIAKKNLGVSTIVNPSVTANLNPADDPGLSSGTVTSSPVNFTGTATPGATVTYKGTNSGDQAVVATVNSSGSYSINVPVDKGENVFNVTTKDGFGQSITGTINPVTMQVSPAVAGAPTTTTGS